MYHVTRCNHHVIMYPVNRSLIILVLKTFILKYLQTSYFKINYITYYYII